MRWLTGILLLLLWCGVASATTIHVCTDAVVGIDAKERADHVDAIRRAMTDAIREARIDAKTADIAVTKLAVVIGEDKIEVSAEIKVVISTSDDQLRSFASGTATFTIARGRYRADRLTSLRHQVLDDALDGLRRRMR